MAKDVERTKYMQSLFISILDDLFSNLTLPLILLIPSDVFDVKVHFFMNENLECPK